MDLDDLWSFESSCTRLHDDGRFNTAVKKTSGLTKPKFCIFLWRLLKITCEAACQKRWQLMSCFRFSRVNVRVDIPLDPEQTSKVRNKQAMGYAQSYYLQNGSLGKKRD